MIGTNCSALLRNHRSLYSATFVLLIACSLYAAPRPATDLTATDKPNDPGHAIDLTWVLSPDDAPEADAVNKVVSYDILREISGTPGFVSINSSPAGSAEFTDPNCIPQESYRYQVVAISSDGSRSAVAETGQAVSPVMQFFDWSRGWFLVILIVVCAAIVGFVLAAKGGAPIYVRKIAGLAAIEEAVGRATEMGRAILFVPGIQDMNEIQTVAGITVLGRVAKVAAEHDASLEVPTSRSLVMTAARETVQAAYLAAGRPDSYNPDKIYYVTDEQFGYVAALTGLMVREKPAACIYMGSFFAESLMLAETGNAVGAIQVAGTAQPAQLPFFVAACDYTLIGEEFFAASAYLSGEPEQLGSLKGQDAGKVMAGFLILIGCGLATLSALIPNSTAITKSLEYLTTQILG